MVDTTHINNLIKRKDQLIKDIEQSEASVRLNSAAPRTLCTEERLKGQIKIRTIKNEMSKIKSTAAVNSNNLRNEIRTINSKLEEQLSGLREVLNTSIIEHNTKLLAIKNKSPALKEEDAKIALIKEESKIRLKGLNQEWKVVIGELKELQDKSPIVFREATEIRRAKKDDENKKISKWNTLVDSSSINNFFSFNSIIRGVFKMKTIKDLEILEELKQLLAKKMKELKLFKDNIDLLVEDNNLSEEDFEGMFKELMKKLALSEDSNGI